MAEYILKSENFLVSQTDESGKIIFANDDFCKIAGYSVEELVGQPHSIVRHKDMPRAAFKDLWDTIKQGKIWTGYVQNATKDGGNYWVYATVYPMRDPLTNQITYMSCRRKPSSREIEEAKSLYKTLH